MLARAKFAAVPVSTGNTAKLAPPPLAPESPTLKKPTTPKPGRVGEVIPPPDPLKEAGLREIAQAVRRTATKIQTGRQVSKVKRELGGFGSGDMLPEEAKAYWRFTGEVPYGWRQHTALGKTSLRPVEHAPALATSESVAKQIKGPEVSPYVPPKTLEGPERQEAMRILGLTGESPLQRMQSLPSWQRQGQMADVIPLRGQSAAPPAPAAAKTAKAHKLSRRMEFRGLRISVETDKGESRHWYDPNNKTKGSTKMKYPYGYIRMTKGVDGDHVDVYIGPNEEATSVYVVHQQKAPDFDKYDEDKCMLGFDSAEAAKKAYLDHYNNDRFFGSMTVMPFEQFKKKVLGTFKRPQKIAEVFYKRGASSALEQLGIGGEKSTLEKAAPWAAGLGAGALTFGLMRRFRPAAAGNPLRALQTAAKDKGFSIATEPGSKMTQRLRSLIFGAPTVNKGQRVGGTVLHHTPAPTPGMGDVNIGEGSLANAMHDKYMFDRIMREGVGAGPGMKGALPDTELLRDALQRARGNPEALKEMFPEGFFIKAREGSMGRGIFTSLEDKGVREALQNPERFIIQRKMPIEQEFRVHTLEGQPFASTHRWMPNKTVRRIWDRMMGGGGGAFVPATGQTRRELEDFVRKSTAHLRTQGGKPLAEAGEATHAAYDVAKLKGGAGYRLIEANPVPGTLMNPVIAQKLQRQVTGRWSKPVAALGAAGVAAPVIGATA